MDRNELVTQYIEINQTLVRLWKAKFFEAADAEGLSPALMGVLSMVDRKQPITGSEIAKEMHITRGAVAQFVDALFELGYLQRETDPNDRRTHYLRLNPKGIEAVKRLEQIRNRLFADLTCTLSDDELRAVIAIDQKIINSLE